MSGPTSATFEDSDEDLVQGPVTRNRGKLLENLGSLISLSKRSVTFADSNKRKSRTSTKGGKKRQKGPEVQVALPLRLYRKSFTRWAPFPKDSKVRQSPEPNHRGQAAESPDQDQDQAPDLTQDHAPDLAQDLVVDVARTIRR